MTDKTSQDHKAPQSPTCATRRTSSSTPRVFYLDMFALELARGGAHIASALTLETRTTAMHEVIADFSQKHGTEDLGVFLGMLVARLEARVAYAAAQVVCDHVAQQATTVERRKHSCNECPQSLT